MNLETLFQELRVMDHLLAVLLGMPRLFMILQTVPFMGGNIVTGQIRAAVAFACYMFIHPMVLGQLDAPEVLTTAVLGRLALVLLKESLLGFLLGFLAGMLFWAVQCAGFFIDNQRGASMASGADPLSGEETTPLGSLLFQCAVYLFFSGGAFVAFITLVFSSYEVWPVSALLPAGLFERGAEAPLFFAGRVAWLMGTMILLSAPIVAACLLTDMSLGLINRFAAQLNVYVLGMPIKSALAAFLLFLSFTLLLTQIEGLFDVIAADLASLRLLFHE
jgi:type III secretion protein T